MDPFNMPSFGSQQDPGARLQQDISATAPLATQYHGAQTGAAISQYIPTMTPTGQSGVSKFFHFFGAAGSEIGHVTSMATDFVGRQLKSMALAPYHFEQGIQHGWQDRIDNTRINTQSTQLTDRELTLHNQYKAGLITSADYKNGLIDIAKSNDALSKTATGMQNRIKADQNQSIIAGIQTVGDVITILTAGFGGPLVASPETQTAAEFLTSTNANAFLDNVSAGLGKLASDPEAFAALSSTAQDAIQNGVAEVVAQSSGMTAGAIARTSAVNLALKYPLYYQMLSSTGTGIYKELDQKKYGDAIRSVAFNAALLLSGGPIGKALEGAGSLVSAAKEAVFGQTSFLDELSKGIGNGTASGLYDAIMKIPEADRAEVIKNMQAVEATNMAAVGKDPVAAAWRVLDGMQSYEGSSMATFSHEEALNNMVNFAKAQRMATTAAEEAGMGAVTVGRVDARALNDVATQLASADDKAAAWESMKQANPSQAWANNETLDKQIKSIISKHGDDVQSLVSAITSIKAGFNVGKGFPLDTAKELAGMGYIPISPGNIEAPFKEGSGKLVSAFADNGSSFFTHAVQPLPVLDHVGNMLTTMGLSPEASTARVYEAFNANVVDALQNTNVFKVLNVVGDTPKQTSDSIIKQLSNYAHGANTKLPITDLRMLTSKDVAKALQINAGDAKDIQGAIQDAMLKVPLEIRSLGDRVVDLNYKFNPLAKPYAKLQGAFRFAWNPFFQGKTIAKTEFLSALEGGSATTAIFAGDYGKLDGVSSMLRDAGVFEKKSSFTQVVSGEAVADGSAVGPNLTHRLLGAQEKSISGLVQTQADKMGMDVKSYIEAYPTQVRDTVNTIVAYDRNASFLNSPMMRTLNLAFFPARFEVKVASIMAESLAKAAPLTQVAVIKGLYNGSNWLKSPEGQAWYSKNSEAIGLFEYFSPLATLSTIADILGTHGTSIGAYGELGGLPFGWIPQLLDAEGLTHFGQSYVNPKTGAIALDYVPVTARGQLQTAISDLIGSLFTYPGATVGAPSKGTVDRWAAAAITGGKSKTDFQTSTPAISPSQQNFQQVVQQLAGNAPNNVMPQTGPAPVQPIKVPAEPSRLLNPPPRKVGGTTTGTKKLKKSKYTPALLPGQTTLGQL